MTIEDAFYFLFRISETKKMGEKTNVVIMFPNSSTAVLLGKTVTSELANLAFFVPGDIHERAANTCYEEVKMQCAGLDVTVEKVATLQSMSTMDYIIFPSLDVNTRKSRADFSVMCRNLFRLVTNIFLIKQK